MNDKWVILPHSLVTEVAAFPDTKASFEKLSAVRMQAKYIPLNALSNHYYEGISAIKNDLTRNIASVIGDLQEEVSFAFDKNIGDAPAWKVMYVYSTVLQIVGRLSARTFVGLPLCRDEEWVKSTINLTTDTVAAVNAIAKYGPWTRPIMGHLVPELKKIRVYSKYFTQKMQPQVAAILAAYKGKTNMRIKPGAAEIDHEDATDDNNNLVHWTIRNFKDPRKASAQIIGDVEMGAAFAAIHTTSMALSHAIFDLAANPEYAAELRAEVNAVIAEENYPDQLLRKTSMPKLRKLDSFIKESQRTNPPGMSMYTPIQLDFIFQRVLNKKNSQHGPLCRG
jgi:cytochrome P450